MMIAVRVIWYGAVYYFRVKADECIVRVFYPHVEEGPIAPRTIPVQVACQALRELYSQMTMH